MVSPSLAKIAYHTLQQGKSIAGLAHKSVSTKLMERYLQDKNSSDFPLSPDVFNKLRKSMNTLQEIDWLEAENGIYPKAQLFEAPWIEWAKKYPLVWLDMPLTWNRRKESKTRDIPKNINRKQYPDYYLQNFHHQTDGYLSKHSAELYDIQVEILFNGTADSMRRRVLSPLINGLKFFNNRNKDELKVLDVATGTGRTLQQIRSALPEVELFGLDLSSSYLKQASKYLSRREGEIVQLAKGNAEEMNYKSNEMNGITCVFLLHELPPKARQNVINECFRLIEPGGVFVLADSIQLSDSPEFKVVMDNFHKVFHEPYYKDYINDDINKRLKNAGFINISAQSHFMTRVWTAYKPTPEKY
ncbi:class I SAM-dependent methyltransferase [Prochlorococcus sp. MIT 1223]|uniref:class I SAM-dependent methyltransferase n=1 Tax=Prochlorococcus sp. MIT 1223 TaxID=3096217 RepID=UPI002A756F25|nr:class I SAM-dependent methyltransferase [Prochlorococcus sp. MIT 1223]